MTADDDKLDFFLRHWKVMEEWSALRRHAAEVLDRQLLRAVESLNHDSETPDLHMIQASVRNAKLHIGKPSRAWIELQWNRAGLFDGSWTTLIVCWHQDRGDKHVRAAVTNAARDLCAERGLTKYKATGWWVWWGLLRPDEEPFDLDEYANGCVGRFRDAWLAMHQPIEDAVAAVDRAREEKR